MKSINRLSILLALVVLFCLIELSFAQGKSGGKGKNGSNSTIDESGPGKGNKPEKAPKLKEKKDKAKCIYETNDIIVKSGKGRVYVQRVFRVEKKNGKLMVKKSKKCRLGQIRVRITFSDGKKRVLNVFTGNSQFSCDFDATVENGTNENGGPLKALLYRSSRRITNDADAPLFTGSLYFFIENGTFTFPDGSQQQCMAGDTKFYFTLEKSDSCVADVCRQAENYTIEWLAACDTSERKHEKISSTNKDMNCYATGAEGNICAPLNYIKDGKNEMLSSESVTLQEDSDDDGGKGNVFSVTISNFTSMVWYDPFMTLPTAESVVEEGVEDEESSSPPLIATIYITLIAFMFVKIIQ